MSEIETILGKMTCNPEHLDVFEELFGIRDREKEERLPVTNVYDFIDKKNVWLVWITDKISGKVKDFKIYDFSYINAPEAMRDHHSVNYVESHVKSYKDWGACSSSWKNTRLQDVLFTFGIQYGFHNNEAKKMFFDHMYLIKEWKKDIFMYMSVMGMTPYFNDI